MTRSTAQEGITSHLLFDTVPTSSPSATTDPVDCPFIVRVRRSSDQAFLGTAFFVSPTLAIGCLHYLQTKDLRGQPSGHMDTVTLDWGTHQVEGHLEFNDAGHDFVALRVHQPPADLTIPAARFAESINVTMLDNLCAPRNLFLKGYLGREDGVARHQVEIRHKPLVQTEREHSDRPFLRDAQFSGGWAEGFSGSPLLVNHRGEWIVLGMAYLGGEKSGNSRVLLADAILELLARECLDEALLKPVPAQHLVEVIRTRQSRQRALYVSGGLAVLALLGSAYSLQDAPLATTATLTEKTHQPDPNEAISQTLTGIFKDSTSNRPLAGVTVALSEFRKTAITDEFGGFEITVNVPRDHMVALSAHKEGFADMTENVRFSAAKQEFILRRRE